MAIPKIVPDFRVIRDENLCINCQACCRVCSNDTHSFDQNIAKIISDHRKCVGCHFCEEICSTGALTIEKCYSQIRENFNWNEVDFKNLMKQAHSGGILLTGMGNDRPWINYFDHIVLNASQVTNPSIDPLREPMEIKTFIGRKPDSIEQLKKEKKLPILLETEIPVLFSAMSYGSISLNACKSIAAAAWEAKTYWNTGEGGLPESLKKFVSRTIVQVASGRFGVDARYLNEASAIEIKIGQGAKPGIGGHLPGEKVTADISAARKIPEGTDAISPAPHHDIYSIEDLKQLIYALKETVDYKKPVGVKVAAVHNIAPIVSGIVRAGADFVTIDGFRGGTGAAPVVIRNNVGIPIEIAIATVDSRLRQEGIRNHASIIAAGGIRSSADVVKAIALGADAVYIGTATLVALGCHICQKCYTGKCNWGIATQDPYLTRRLNPEIGKRRLTNLLRAWALEIKEMMGGMGINAIESLRGNRDQLRGIGLNDKELALLGIKHAGDAW
ncbi:MAG TPA: glutamate synthase-related protein [bacterium]|nr:glutamate synthase-related protein [bacterium]HOL34825.1 glutamate synthase-related protein [bacterium]HPP07890.1 glutamate synthase-related protein [bacterium]